MPIVSTHSGSNAAKSRTVIAPPFAAACLAAASAISPP